MILKLKRTPGIYLVGFMASGKTTVGRLLADELGWHFADIDDDIERTEGASIAEIFDTRGEAEFRRIESLFVYKRVREVQQSRPMVVAVGGGAFAQKTNHEMLVDNGVPIWLDCTLDRISERLVGTSHRPLARDPDGMKQLFEDRRDIYAKADYRVEISCDDPAVAVADIMKLPIF